MGARADSYKMTSEPLAEKWKSRTNQFEIHKIKTYNQETRFIFNDLNSNQNQLIVLISFYLKLPQEVVPCGDYEQGLENKAVFLKC